MRIILRPDEELVVEFRDSDRIIDISYREDIGIRVNDNDSGSSEPDIVEPRFTPTYEEKLRSMTVENAVKTILKERLNLDDNRVINLTDNIQDDLGADSLDGVELVMAFEEVYNFEIDDPFPEGVSTVEDCIKYIKKNAPI